MAARTSAASRRDVPVVQRESAWALNMTRSRTDRYSETMIVRSRGQASGPRARRPVRRRHTGGTRSCRLRPRPGRQRGPRLRAEEHRREEPPAVRVPQRGRRRGVLGELVRRLPRAACRCSRSCSSSWAPTACACSASASTRRCRRRRKQRPRRTSRSRCCWIPLATWAGCTTSTICRSWCSSDRGGKSPREQLSQGVRARSPMSGQAAGERTPGDLREQLAGCGSQLHSR